MTNKDKIQYDNNQIWYLIPYIPKYTGKSDANSELILKFKDYDLEAIEYFAEQIGIALETLVKGHTELLANRAICVVPSHSANKWSTNLLQIADFLIEKYKMINAKLYIRRIKDHDKLSYGGVRSKESHLETLAINKDHVKISTDSVILLDDVATTGNSIDACVELLENNDIKRIRSIVLGQTLRSRHIDTFLNKGIVKKSLSKDDARLHWIKPKDKFKPISIFKKISITTE